jgi:hypothetical protein
MCTSSDDSRLLDPDDEGRIDRREAISAAGRSVTGESVIVISSSAYGTCDRRICDWSH